MMKLLVREGKPGNLRERYRELLKLMQIRDIREIIFRRMEVLKEEFKKDIEGYDFSIPEQPETDGNIIHMNPLEYYYYTEDLRLRDYFDFLRNRADLREMVLEEFYTLLKPMYHEEQEKAEN